MSPTLSMLAKSYTVAVYIANLGKDEVQKGKVIHLTGGLEHFGAFGRRLVPL